ncbi:MAG: preprotein translocase subunit YajC [Alphaproteobacteria bacterium]|nr:preprotein translocase subunit YajC [Alphaproteobacteria bacterium]MCB9696384.1 preprotein translocase subunit YajC [Alphaproteobacteria bacterium]
MNPVDFLPILLIFGVMYFMVIRPQLREKGDHDKLLASLAKGDRVVTSSGIHGTVNSVDGDTLSLEIAEKTRITIEKSSIARREGDPAPGATPGKA